ncbi:MAG: hypothetical protein M3Q69_19245, partial [Acidobacteriota bacterium]|nr:hypothetical protein [Acidobacteriota bacterium]
LAGAVQTSRMSDRARSYFATTWTTTTNADGLWTLPGRSDGAVPLLFEARGFAPLQEFRAPVDGTPPVTILQKGAALRATLDRADADQLILLVRDSTEGAAAASQNWERPVWSRSAASTTLSWDSLPAGKYSLTAYSTDPARFASPSALGSVTIAAGDAREIRLTLPRSPKRDPDALLLFVPRRSSTELDPLRAVVSNSSGATEVQHAFERASGGTLIYLRTKASPADLFLATRDHVITAGSVGKGTAESPLTTVSSGRADISVRFAASEGAPPIPSWTMAHFGGCTPNSRIVLAAAVSKEGTAELAFPTACHSVVLRLPPFAPVLIQTSMAPRQVRSFGPYVLDLAAAADVRVVREPSGATVPGALVRALTMRASDEVVFAEGVAGQDGRLALTGLPADRELIIEARDPATQDSGSARLRTAAGSTVAVDPLPIPEPASLVVVPRLAAETRERLPNARIDSVALELVEEGLRAQRRNAQFEKTGEASFTGLRPGKWQLVVIVEGSGTIQPVPVDDVELRPGETRRLDVVVEPPVFNGRVVRGGDAVPAQVAFGDPPGADAVIRSTRTDPLGRFVVLLPKRGTYRVKVTPLAEPETRIDLGEVDFSDPAQPVTLELPSSALAVRVRKRGEPAHDVEVIATLRRTTAYGTGEEVRRRAQTNGSGDARIEALLPGRWLVQATEPSTRSRAEAAVEIRAGEPAAMELDIREPSALAGVVRQPNGSTAGGASVICLFAGPSGLPQLARAATDAEGRFTMDLPTPPPQQLQCGVATASGQIGAYRIAPGPDADLRLPSEAGALLIEDWGAEFNWDVFWLVSRDGRAFNLSWAAAKTDSGGAQLTVARMPAGAWKIVRVATAEDWLRLANGDGGAGNALTEFNVEAGEVKTIHLRGQKGGL